MIAEVQNKVCPPSVTKRMSTQRDTARQRELACKMGEAKCVMLFAASHALHDKRDSVRQLPSLHTAGHGITNG